MNITKQNNINPAPAGLISATKSLISFISIAILLLGLASCEKRDTVNVVYQVDKASEGFMVNYRDADGTLIKTQVETNSANEKWMYKFEAEEGDIVFVSAIQKNIESGIQVMIKLDGKIYKMGSTTNDTIKFVTISGTIPY